MSSGGISCDTGRGMILMRMSRKILGWRMWESSRILMGRGLYIKDRGAEERLVVMRMGDFLSVWIISISASGL